MRRAAIVIVVGLWLSLGPANSFAASSEIAARPTPTTIRYDEDWSVLADPARRSGRPREQFKYIPLTASGNIYLTTGLELRLRNETYENNLWGAAPDESYEWLRALPLVDLHVGSFRAFVQPIAAYAWGVKPSESGVDQTGVDLLQGFVGKTFLLGGAGNLGLRFGRSLMALGSERLVGTRYGPNVPRAFDGGHVIFRDDALKMRLFYVRPVEPALHDFDDHGAHTQKLWGVYATKGLGLGHESGIDTYYLGYRNSDAVFNQGSGRELRHTVGTRFFGNDSGWHWDIELMGQFGTFNNDSIRAWSVATEQAYQFASAPLQPDLRLRFNIASGDKNPDNPTLNTFNPLFPKGKYFGELSPIGPYNLINLQPGLGLTLTHSLTLDLSLNMYWRQSVDDGIYDIPGQLLRSANGSSARYVGEEAEALVTWQVNSELALSGSLAAFVPGAFIRQTGPDQTIYMLGLEANYRF